MNAALIGIGFGCAVFILALGLAFVIRRVQWARDKATLCQQRDAK